MSDSVIISRQYHSNSAFKMIFVCYEENWQVKKMVYVYMVSMRISGFGCSRMSNGSTFLMIKQNLKTTEIINSIASNLHAK